MSESTSQPTGVAQVDQAVQAIEGLAEDDVSAHPAAFEKAHEDLRRALDAQPTMPDALRPHVER